eukprot:3730494-Lingulodinium_polyedra.AAC.1
MPRRGPLDGTRGALDAALFGHDVVAHPFAALVLFSTCPSSVASSVDAINESSNEIAKSSINPSSIHHSSIHHSSISNSVKLPRPRLDVEPREAPVELQQGGPLGVDRLILCLDLGSQD